MYKRIIERGHIKGEENKSNVREGGLPKALEEEEATKESSRVTKNSKGGGSLQLTQYYQGRGGGGAGSEHEWGIGNSQCCRSIG